MRSHTLPTLQPFLPWSVLTMVSSVKLGSRSSLPLAERLWEHPGDHETQAASLAGPLSRPSKLVAHSPQLLRTGKSRFSQTPGLAARIISPPAFLDIMLLAVSDSSDARCRLGAGDPAFSFSSCLPAPPYEYLFVRQAPSSLGPRGGPRPWVNGSNVESLQ
ncbi:hypothetical protein BDP81DRAFT_113152 [Colletotrichum phormii]|uniref:Uncharacterized protein n=1 Tax=Colletotrichum phormii TaxID=359342 RepID=A0AAI9ZGZ2_9PEZI|nr:uncharacterized protein BDP81DRAFT_113152 [Colletotrichum phormii]KAK1624281.1 hypothetical protein BDP81DRAFT_113152 [Colletotrichum phormii]